MRREEKRIKGSKDKFHIDQSFTDQFDRVPKKKESQLKRKISSLYLKL